MKDREYDDNIDLHAEVDGAEELQAKPGALALIPLVRRRDVEVGSRLGNQPILGHRSGFAKRRSTSRAGRARLGSRR